MGSQNSPTSLPSQVSGADAWDSRASVNERSELVQEKPGIDATDRKTAEKCEEQTSEPHTSGPTTSHRSTFLTLPKEIRNAIYSYALAIEGSYISSSGVAQGVICLADEPGHPPKLCDLAYIQGDDQRFLEEYFTEDHDLLKPFISRKADASCIEINQIKYVSKQLYHETWGLTLKINAGTKMVFHGTKVEESSGIARFSGMANFVEFYEQCSPEQQKHIRDVDIIELSMEDERPKILGPSFVHARLGSSNAPTAEVPRTWGERIMALKVSEVFQSRSLTPEEFDKRSFRRRCAELTGQVDAASRKLYKICQQNPSLHVIVRYNEYQDCVDGEWIRRMCTYCLALRNEVGIAMSKKEKETLRKLLLLNGGPATSSALENLRMSSSVNFSMLSAPPSHYCIGVRNVGMGQVSVGQRLKESLKLFQEGV